MDVARRPPLRSAPLSSWGTSLSGALGRVTLFSERPEEAYPQGTKAQRSSYRAGARLGI